jgi:hypothetical protein
MITYLFKEVPHTPTGNDIMEWEHRYIAHACYVCADYYNSHTTTHWMDSLKSSEINLDRWHGQEMGPWT